MQRSCRAEHKKCGNSFTRQVRGPGFTPSQSRGQHSSGWVGPPLMSKRKTSCRARWDRSSCFHYFGLSAQWSPLSQSSKCPLDLLFSCLHLKQFIKNEWNRSFTLRAAWREGAGDRIQAEHGWRSQSFPKIMHTLETKSPATAGWSESFCSAGVISENVVTSGVVAGRFKHIGGFRWIQASTVQTGVSLLCNYEPH